MIAQYKVAIFRVILHVSDRQVQFCDLVVATWINYSCETVESDDSDSNVNYL